MNVAMSESTDGSWRPSTEVHRGLVTAVAPLIGELPSSTHYCRPQSCDSGDAFRRIAVIRGTNCVQQWTRNAVAVGLPLTSL